MNSITLSVFVAALTLAHTVQAQTQPVFVDAPSLISVSEEIQTARVDQPPVIAYAGNGKWVAAWVGEKNFETDSRASSIYYATLESPCNRWSEWRPVYSSSEEMASELLSLDLVINGDKWLISFTENGIRKGPLKNCEVQRLLCRASLDSGWTWEPVQVLEDFKPMLDPARAVAIATQATGTTLGVWGGGIPGSGMQQSEITYEANQSSHGNRIPWTLTPGFWPRPNLTVRGDTWILTSCQRITAIDAYLSILPWEPDTGTAAPLWYFRSEDAGARWKLHMLNASSPSAAIVVPGIASHWVAFEVGEPYSRSDPYADDLEPEIYGGSVSSYESWDDGRSWRWYETSSPLETSLPLEAFMHYGIDSTLILDLRSDESGTIVMAYQGRVREKAKKLFIKFSQDDGVFWSNPYQVCREGLVEVLPQEFDAVLEIDQFCEDITTPTYSVGEGALAIGDNGVWKLAYALNESDDPEYPLGIYTLAFTFGESDSSELLVDADDEASCVEGEEAYVPPNNNILACTSSESSGQLSGDAFVIVVSLLLMLSSKRILAC